MHLRFLRALAVVFVGWCAASCGNEGEPPSKEPLRDGSSTLRLVYNRSIELGSVERDGAQVAFANGAKFLFVRGDCHYWAWQSNPLSVTAETREGDLSMKDQEALMEDVDYPHWNSLAGHY